MAGARARAEWAQTSALMALVWNMQPGLKSCDRRKPDDFNPVAVKPKEPEPLEVPISVLKVFCQPGAVDRLR